jgi:hypothetical protein
MQVCSWSECRQSCRLSHNGMSSTPMMVVFPIALFVAWLFGITGADADDPFVHLLLIVGVVLLVMSLFTRTRTAA